MPMGWTSRWWRNWDRFARLPAIPALEARETRGEIVFHVFFLGGLDVYCGSQPLRFATRKTAALFAFLAYHAGKSFLRDSLADRFWPECDTDQARNSLRV